MFDEILNRVGHRIQKKETNTVCDHKRFCCIHATLLLIMMSLHYYHEVQVTLTRRFAMTTFSPRKFCTSSKIGPTLPDLGDHLQLPIGFKRSLGFFSALEPIFPESPRFIERSTIFPQYNPEAENKKMNGLEVSRQSGASTPK